MKKYSIVKRPNRYSNEMTLLTINKNMQNMTVDEFVKFMRDAVTAAQNEYSQIIVEYNKIAKQKDFERYSKSVWGSYKAKLDSYKRESARQAKIKEIEKKIEKHVFFPHGDDIFFDTMPVLNKGGLMKLYTSITTNTSDNDFAKIYYDYKKFIDMSDGISFKYDIVGDDPITVFAFRPWVDFIIPQNIMKTLQRERKEYDEEAGKFYASLNYKGD